METVKKVIKDPVAIISLIIATGLVIYAFITRTAMGANLALIGLGLILLIWSIKNILKGQRIDDQKLQMIGFAGLVMDGINIIYFGLTILH